MISIQVINKVFIAFFPTKGILLDTNTFSIYKKKKKMKLL